MTPAYIKNWRGPALDVEKARVIKQRQGIVPTLEELEKAGLIEQKTITKYLRPFRLHSRLGDKYGEIARPFFPVWRP